MIHRFAVEIPGGSGNPAIEEGELAIERLEDNRWRVTHAGRTRVLEAARVAGQGRAGTWSIMPEGGGACVQVDVDGSAPDLTVTVDNVSMPIKLTAARLKLAGVAARIEKTGPSTVQSPMPGKVVKLLVAAGDEVKSGQGVAVVEAMKMENELRAPRDAKVKSVAVKEGQAVEAGQTLITLE
jgi:biotin carboxyl carrier protein